MALERKKTASLGQLLLKLNKITPEQLKKGLAVQKEEPSKRLGEVLVDLGYISRDELFEVLALQIRCPYIELGRYKLDKQIIGLIPKETLKEYQIVPVDRFGNILTIAMINPLDKEAEDAVKKITGLEVRVFAVDHQELEKTLELISKDG